MCHKRFLLVLLSSRTQRNCLFTCRFWRKKKITFEKIDFRAHTLLKVCPSVNMVASYKTKSESANKRLNQRCTEMESTWFLRFLLFRWVFHQKPMALRPSYSTAEETYLRKTDFYSQRVVDGKIKTPRSLKHCCSSSPSHLLTAHQPGRFAGAEPRRPKGAQVVQVGWGAEPWALAPVQNQPFLPEGETLSPLDWNLILFYTEIEL